MSEEFPLLLTRRRLALSPGQGSPTSARSWIGVLGACLLPCLLASCASDISRTALPDSPRVDKLAQLAMPAKAIGLTDEGDDQGSDVISTHGRADLIPTPLDDSDPLPKYNVPWLSFANTPLQDVLQAIAVDAKLAMSVVWDNPASKISRSSVSMSHLSGDLTGVLNKLADSYGFYWRYKDGMLHITADRQYVAPVPPIADLFESLPIMVKTLGGTDVFLDKSARMITFRAGSQSFFKIKSYLEMTRKNRSLIVYDTFIWEVILNDGSKMGIDWGALPGAVPTTAITTGPAASLASATNLLSAGLINAASGGTGLALSFAGSRFSMNLLIDFLRSQGTINSLSQPKIQLLSGGKAVLKDEIATTYVSRIGNPSISAGTVIPGSVETSQVKTGVTLEVTGDVSDDTIYSDIALRVSDLLGMSSATVSGSTISLPRTASREVHTHVRAKPGDTILLAGIQYDKLQNTANTALGMVKSNQSEVSRSELIIVMRPRIKHFVPHGDDEKVALAPIAASLPKPAASPATLEKTPTPAPVRRVLPPALEPAAPAQPVAASKALTTPPASPPVTPARISPPSPTEAVAAPSPPPGIYMQLGAFGNPDNAESLRQDVDQRLGWRRDAGQSLSVVTTAQPNRPEVYRLLAGPFADRQAAEQWAERGQKIVGSRPILYIR